MIKPDAVEAGNSGLIIHMIENHGFTIVRMEKRTVDVPTAECFYAIHRARPFFKELVDFITSGPVIVMALEREDAVVQWRTLMGATNPKDAAAGTIRRLYGTSIGANAAHGSDSPDTAASELGIFFPDLVRM
jgi:nucleoside-diphosphate kinase